MGSEGKEPKTCVINVPCTQSNQKGYLKEILGVDQCHIQRLSAESKCAIKYELPTSESTISFSVSGKKVKKGCRLLNEWISMVKQSNVGFQNEYKPRKPIDHQERRNNNTTAVPPAKSPLVAAAAVEPKRKAVKRKSPDSTTPSLKPVLKKTEKVNPTENSFEIPNTPVSVRKPLIQHPGSNNSNGRSRGFNKDYTNDRPDYYNNNNTDRYNNHRENANYHRPTERDRHYQQQQHPVNNTNNSYYDDHRGGGKFHSGWNRTPPPRGHNSNYQYYDNRNSYNQQQQQHQSVNHNTPRGSPETSNHHYHRRHRHHNLSPTTGATAQSKFTQTLRNSAENMSCQTDRRSVTDSGAQTAYVTELNSIASQTTEKTLKSLAVQVDIKATANSVETQTDVVITPRTTTASCTNDEKEKHTARLVKYGENKVGLQLNTLETLQYVGKILFEAQRKPSSHKFYHTVSKIEWNWKTSMYVFSLDMLAPVVEFLEPLVTIPILDVCQFIRSTTAPAPPVFKPRRKVSCSKENDFCDCKSCGSVRQEECRRVLRGIVGSVDKSLGCQYRLDGMTSMRTNRKCGMLRNTDCHECKNCELHCVCAERRAAEAAARKERKRLQDLEKAERQREASEAKRLDQERKDKDRAAQDDLFQAARKRFLQRTAKAASECSDPAVVAKLYKKSAPANVILGLTIDATEREVKDRYRKLALLWHPDKAASASKDHKVNTAAFLAITESYKVLLRKFMLRVLK